MAFIELVFTRSYHDPVEDLEASCPIIGMYFPSIDTPLYSRFRTEGRPEHAGTSFRPSGGRSWRRRCSRRVMVDCCRASRDRHGKSSYPGLGVHRRTRPSLGSASPPAGTVWPLQDPVRRNDKAAEKLSAPRFVVKRGPMKDGTFDS
jgi:hypothetical protein